MVENVAFTLMRKNSMERLRFIVGKKMKRLGKAIHRKEIKMKKIRKWIACLMAIIIVFGTAAPVFAQDVEYTGADAGTGKITIENANVGSEYKIYKLFDATVTGAGETAKIAYSGTVPTDLATYFTADTAGNITATDAATTTGGDVMSEGLRGALKTWAETATVTAQATSDGTALILPTYPTVIT